ncbi:hypothetical protein C8F04DRAFT_1094571 [Mycena alexandri]|uniref:Uncharacterized protein n=1 Tax=Mycena alexandri TaxID=1745969 RepID=A0AAD6X4Z4_9AGAR|nr:hypothetical protein C8F04DRAFT_1094571 [Mycena alexandri]
MAHKSELRIIVTDDLDWPALQVFCSKRNAHSLLILQESSILTPHSLWPQDVTLDDDEALSVSLLTPNSVFGKFPSEQRSRTPSSSHTFGFPLSPLSAVSESPPESQSPLEKQKGRLRRYNTAESVLARLPPPLTLSSAQIRDNAVRYASSSVAARIGDVRQSLKVIRSSGRRDSTRWMAEHRLTALEAMQAELTSSSLPQAGNSEDETRRRREGNLVRFLGVHRGEGLVPVFTRTRGRRPPIRLSDETERRYLTVGSPMKLQSHVPIPETPRSEWPWETRVRSVLLYPANPKPPVSPLRISTPTSSLALSTPTSGTFSIPEPETPLTEVEDEDDEDEYEEYPTFQTDSVESYPSEWFPRRAMSASKLPPIPKPQMSHPVSLPPITTDLRPDASYAWLSDSSTWASSSAWHGDGWEVPASASSSISESSTASPVSASPLSASTSASSPSPSPSAAQPRTPTRTQTLPPPPAHRFWTRERHRRLPSLRPIAEAARDSALYAVKPLPPPPQPLSPPSSEKKGRNFFAGLVRRKLTEPAERALETAREAERERERNKLRKRG